MQTLVIPPFAQPARGTVSVPGSKSINNRALLLAALAEGTSTLTGALDSDDTRYFAACLRALGFAVAHDAAAEAFTITGCGGILPTPPTAQPDLFVGNAGTAARFLLALCALGTSPVRFDGVAAMQARPMGGLLDVLAEQGAVIACEGTPDHLPLVLTGSGLPGGTVSLDASKSSQLLSAALMVAPFARTDTTIHLTGDIVSEPYIAMTIAMMADWGVVVDWPDLRVLKIGCAQSYAAKAAYPIEPDASSASYFFAAAAVTGGEVTVRGLSRAALQGDVGFVDALAAMGARVFEGPEGLSVQGPAHLHGATLDMNAISDTAPTLAAIASNATSPVTITGVEHMRWKETDRIAAMTTQLRAMGAEIEEHRDGFTIHPARLHCAQVATYDDHRMAMSLAIAGLANAGVVIEDPACTSKTFPTFFAVLEDLRAQSSAANASEPGNSTPR
jgi:3-phosphoshikimate 1-carboxyvinyltransferase